MSRARGRDPLRTGRRWTLVPGCAALLTALVPAPAVVAPEFPTFAAASAATPPAHATTGATGAGLGVQVSGTNLIDATGAPILLRGASKSGAEYACVSRNADGTIGSGIFDGTVDASTVAAMASWGLTAIRVPLNEDCWLGINGVAPQYSGVAYQSAIESLVSSLNARGMVVILDLHWNAPGTMLATGQEPMADEDHSPAFWSSVGAAFASTPGVIFDLYNEPHSVSWDCWLNGCTTQGFQTAGMQQLVNAVRSAGAHQPIMLGGLSWADDLSGWLSHEPVDPGVGGTDAAPSGTPQLVASFHNYCGDLAVPTCLTPDVWPAIWTLQLQSVLPAVPLVTGEFGEFDCGDSFTDAYMNWADAHHVSYLQWAWMTYDCKGFPSMLVDAGCHPTPYGEGLLSHIVDLRAGDAPGITLRAPVVGMAATPDGHGYWLVASDGGVFAYGDASFYGSAGAIPLVAPIVGIAATPDGHGYRLATSDGGVFAFGDAAYAGSGAGSPGPDRTTGIASSSDGGGYWLVSSSGAVSAFGDAPILGGAAPETSSQIVAVAATPDHSGYWLASGAGSVYAYGDAGFYGPNVPLSMSSPVVAVAPTPDGRGYWLAGADGSVFSFGDATYEGSLGATPARYATVGIVAPDAGGYWLPASNGAVMFFGDAGFFGSPD